jgi:hypothetical protein
LLPPLHTASVIDKSNTILALKRRKGKGSKGKVKREKEKVKRRLLAAPSSNKPAIEVVDRLQVS